MPRRLLTRLFLLIALLMATSVIAWTAIFTLVDREPRARQFAQLLTSVANITRAAVIAAAPEQRQQLLMELSRQEGIRIDIAEADENPAPPPDDPFLRDVLVHLRNALGPETELLVLKDDSPALFLKIFIDGDAYWIVLPRERFNQSRSFQWLGWGLLAAALALLAAGWFVSRLTRPLQRLAGAATDIGAGRHPPPLPIDGPDEMATVTRAFNRMNADLGRLEQDRALVLAGISHDLRTPLTRLRMELEMSPGDETLRANMIADIEDIDRTIGQFLDFARGDGGENIVETDLSDMLGDIANQFERHGTRIALTCPAGLQIRAKRQALRRAIANLVDNALRHADSDSPIELQLTQKDARVVISVRDHGPGIPEQDLDRVRRPFTRLDPARGDGSGSGLGLAIVERIAFQMGGRLDLANCPDGGLRASIVLPMDAIVTN